MAVWLDKTRKGLYDDLLNFQWLNNTVNWILGYVSSKYLFLHFILQRWFFLFDFSGTKTFTAKNTVISPDFLVWKFSAEKLWPETMRKLRLSSKFPHQEIRWNYRIFRSDFIQAIITFVGTAILSRINVDCVFLASMLNSIFVLLEVLSQYLVAVIIRGIFRTLTNMMELLVKIHT